MVHFHTISLFPNVIEEYVSTSIIKKAKQKGHIDVTTYNPIDFLKGNERVDDRPYGGGPGMVLRPEPFLEAYKAAKGRSRDVVTIFFDPRGEPFTTKMAEKLKDRKNIILFCGHYEGIDHRVCEVTDAIRVSVGEVILTGGEIPALSIIDGVTRKIPGVLGNTESIEEHRIASSKSYTRPESIKWKNKKYSVPKTLLSGNHSDIEDWKKAS